VQRKRDRLSNAQTIIPQSPGLDEHKLVCAVSSEAARSQSLAF
jgi:hypothetical protein